MKKILTSSLLIVAMAVFTGCLKDKGFENQEYGLQVQNSKANRFPQAKNSPVSFGLNSQTTPLVLRAPVVTLESDGADASDINVVIESNPALVAAYPNLTLLPSSEYTFTSNLTIPAGKRNDTMSITLPNSSTLDPNISYAVGFTIISASNNYIVASNARNIVLKFTIKNKYDGIYTATGSFKDNVNAAFTGIYPKEYYLTTTGANSVTFGTSINGEIAPGYLFSNAGAGTYFGNFGLQVFFNTTTDAIAEVRNYYGDPNNPSTGVGDPANGNGAPLYQAAAPARRSAVLDPSGVNAYDPVTKTIRIKYFMRQANVPQDPRSEFTEVLVYNRPR